MTTILPLSLSTVLQLQLQHCWPYSTVVEAALLASPPLPPIPLPVLLPLWSSQLSALGAPSTFPCILTGWNLRGVPLALPSLQVPAVSPQAPTPADPSLETESSENMAVLRCPSAKGGDCVVFLVGTAHVSQSEEEDATPALYCTVLYCTVLYCTVLYCTVLHCTVPDDRDLHLAACLPAA